MPIENIMGIDVSKERLDVDTVAEGSVRIANNGRGHYRIFAQAKRLGIQLVVLESTGDYEEGLVDYLSGKHIELNVANPRQVRDFAKGLGMLAKTDVLDARVLRAFGESIPQRRYIRPSQDQARLYALVKERMHLVRLLATEKQRLIDNGKPVKVALTAVMRKTLIQCDNSGPGHKSQSIACLT
jgi:transposase